MKDIWGQGVPVISCKTYDEYDKYTCKEYLKVQPSKLKYY